MEFKGTKGKWKATKMDIVKQDVYLILDKERYQVAISDNRFIKDAETVKANAQLIAHAPEMYDEIKESITDLLCIQSNVFDAYKTDNRWEGVYEIIQKQIDRKKDLLTRATTI